MTQHMFLSKRSQYCNLVNLKQVSFVFGNPFNKYYFPIVYKQFNSSLNELDNEIEKSREICKFYLDNLGDLYQEMGKNIKLTYMEEDAYTKYIGLHYQTTEEKILSKTQTVDYQDLRYKHSLACGNLQEKIRQRKEIVQYEKIMRNMFYTVLSFNLLLFLYYLHYLM